MTRRSRTPWTMTLTVGKRFAFLTVLGGGLVAAAAFAGGHLGVGVVLAVGFALIAAMGLAPGELSGLRRNQADERQRTMLFESVAWSGYLVRPVIFIGAVVEAFRGTPGPFVLIAALTSVVEVVGVLALPRTR